MGARVIHLINPKTDSLTTRPCISIGPSIRPWRACWPWRRDSPRPIRSGADRRKHRNHRLRPEGRPRRHFRHDQLCQPRLRDRRRVPRPGRAGRHGRRPSQLHAAGGPDTLRRGGVGEAELVIEKLLDDLEQGAMRGLYKSADSHPMAGMADAALRPDQAEPLHQRHFVQTSRGCRQGCTFCAEPLMNGLKVRYRRSTR